MIEDYCKRYLSKEDYDYIADKDLLDEFSIIIEYLEYESGWNNEKVRTYLKAAVNKIRVAGCKE